MNLAVPRRMGMAGLMLGWLLAGPALAAGKDCAKGRITVTGLVHNPGSVQEEPGETPQMNFMLQKPSCGAKDILVGGPGPLLCSEGDRATVVGDYSPPDRLMGIPILSPAKVTCRSAGR
jgi:hypothetical protein